MGRPRCFSSIFFLRLEVCSRLSMGLSLQICFLSPENSSTAPRPSPRQLMEMAPRCGTEKGAGQARKSTSPPGLSNVAGTEETESDKREREISRVSSEVEGGGHHVAELSKSPHNKVFYQRNQPLVPRWRAGEDQSEVEMPKPPQAVCLSS